MTRSDISSRLESRPLPGERFVYKRFYANVIPGAVHLLIFLAALATAIASSAAPRVFAGLAVAFFAVSAWRSFHVRLELQPNDVVIANTSRTHTLRWADVEYVYVEGDRIVFHERGSPKGIAAAVTRKKARDRRLVGQLRRYAEPHGVRFDDALRQA